MESLESIVDPKQVASKPSMVYKIDKQPLDTPFIRGKRLLTERRTSSIMLPRRDSMLDTPPPMSVYLPQPPSTPPTMRSAMHGDIMRSLPSGPWYGPRALDKDLSVYQLQSEYHLDHPVSLEAYPVGNNAGKALRTHPHPRTGEARLHTLTY